MKKIIMVIVCLMTMIVSVNAQNYDQVIISGYENWVKYNDGKTIEDFVKTKFLIKHHYVSDWGCTAEVGSYARNIYEDDVKREKEREIEYIHNPIVDDFYSEANHSDEYGHFNVHFKTQCLHKGKCLPFGCLTYDRTEYDSALHLYGFFSEECLICKEEKKLVGTKLYEKLLKKRYHNWVSSEEYKKLKEKNYETKKALKKIEKEIENLHKEIYKRIIN